MPRGRPRGSRNMKKKVYGPNRSTLTKYKNRVNKRGTLVRLIKKISLGQHETKQVHRVLENINVNHNQGYAFTNLLYTTQGINDNDTGANNYNCRLGDEVQGKGISIKLWIANKLDRPNIMYRLVVFKYQSQSIPTLSSIFVGANGNKIMDDLDREYITPVYQKLFNLQVGYSAYPSGSLGDADGREAHIYKKIYIPLKDKKIHYNNGGSVPKFVDYGFALIPYDSYGTLTTDNICSFSYQMKFYFKDA